jgi:hypothetical protein
MTAIDDRLAAAIADSVIRRLDQGVRFLRVAQVVSPLPVAELMALITARYSARFAVFGDTVATVDGFRWTADVSEAIDWRNDPQVEDALIILGDLDRDRAAGLAEVITFPADEPRSTLFRSLIKECDSLNPPNLFASLLRALGDLRALTDLSACAEYCESLLPVDSGTIERARSELWRLRLLPDSKTADFDQKALRRNAETVVRLLALDATSLQRLMQHVGELGPERYEAVRRFASSGDPKQLKLLEYADVFAALKAVGTRSDNATSATATQPTASTLSRIVATNPIDEKDFLEQVRALPESSSADRTVSVGGETLDWSLTNLEPVLELMSDTSSDTTYAQVAGSIERISTDEPIPAPGIGSATWTTYEDIALDLERLARRANTAPDGAEHVRAIEVHRTALEPFAESLLDEGARLFIASPTLRAEAEGLIEATLALWTSLGDLRGALVEADRGYVLDVAEKLTAADLRVVVHGSDVSAYVLPLHPIVIEPRLRAAQLLADTPDIPSDLFDLVVEALDPAMPSLAVRFDGGSAALGYAGVRNGLLHYTRTPHQVDGADVPQTIKQIIGRFISVHPYAELSFSLGLVSPPPRVAKTLMRWLGEADIRRARIDAYVLPGEDDEIRNVLNDAMEEMISGEVANAATRFAFSVTSLNRLSELPGAIDQSEGPPHVLLFFDLAEVDQSGLGAAANSPMVGTLVSEWEFSTNPLEDSRPVIRPRSGSNELADLVNTQAGLFGSSVPSQQRSPLLSEGAEQLLAELADHATWMGTIEGMAAFVPTPRIGDLDLLGRIGGTSHVAFLYSAQGGLLLEPILRYLQKSTWLHPDQGALAEFLLGTVRRAVPEGLLGFFKVRGSLSNEAVLGRLGFAAVLAYLNDERPGRLVVSLDTEGARRWLGLRDGPEMRADLLAIELGDQKCSIEAIEVKSRTDVTPWANQPPEWITHAISQVSEMDRLLRQMFCDEEVDALTPSRREILKRQVFLEALQQWEPLRESDSAQYEMQIAQLNRLFNKGLDVETSRRVFVVSTKSTDEVASRDHGSPVTRITTLGVSWFKRALAATPGSEVTIDLAVLDEFAEMFDDISAEDDGGENQSFGVASRDCAPPVPARGSAVPHDAVPTSVADEAVAAGPAAAATDVPDQDAGTSTALPLAMALRDALIARKVQFRAIQDDAIVVGPSVIQIPFSLQPGTRIAALQSQEADLARDLGVESVRIDNWASRPGYAVAQLPRRDRAFPNVDTLVRPDDAFYPALALGAQLNFEPFWVGLDSLPHLLVGGTSGSGKSVFLRSVLRQLTHLYSADDLDLVIIDAKGMSDYLDFRSAPQIKQPGDFHLGVEGALDLLAEIVENRLPMRTEVFRSYATQALAGTPPRHVTNLRELLAHAGDAEAIAPLRPLVIVIDEFAELVLASSDRKRFETLVTRFSQTARAVGGHLIAATQRPSTDVVTGLMKSNFARVALRTQQKVDSRVILDENGAEALLGKGDLLFRSLDSGLVRLQGYAAPGPYTIGS